jgi:flagellar protein FliS
MNSYGPQGGMYSSNYSVNQYRSNSVNTSPVQLVVMCYDGMLRFMRQAREGILEKNIEKRVKFINKTLAIISELQATLDFNQGPEVAKNLDRVYNYLNRQLMKASLEKNAEIVEGCENLVRELREAWAQVAAQEGPGGGPQGGGGGYGRVTPQSNVSISG